MVRLTLLALLPVSFMLWNCTATPHKPYYRNIIARTLNDRAFDEDQYRWVCEFVTRDTVFPSAIARIAAPTGEADSYARFAQMVRCHERTRAHFNLNELCERDLHAWHRVAGRELRRCAHAPLSAQDRNEKKGLFPARFSRANCEARYRARRDDGRREALMLCLCDQAQFSTSFPEVPPVVSVGSARFSTLGAQAGSDAELRVLQRCIEDVIPSASMTCGMPSSDFNVLGRHLMETCCKRARTELRDRKFECKQLVPDNLSLLEM